MESKTHSLVNDKAGPVFRQWYKTEDVCTGATCSVTLPQSLVNGTDTWWIQTWNTAGYGPWSTGMAFSVER